MADVGKITLLCTPTEILCSAGGSTEEWYGFYTTADGALRFGQKATKPPTAAITKTLQVHALYGAFSLLRGYYLAVVTRATQVAFAPGGAPIYQVDDMDWIPIGSHHAPHGKVGGAGKPASSGLTAAEDKQEQAYLSLLRDIAETRSFYFAVGYDLTNSLQRNDAIASATNGAASPVPSPSPSATSPHPHWLHCDDRFWWNKTASREIIAAGAHDFVTPIINGFVGSARVPAQSLTLLLVSRRACMRQGTRFNMRGADSDGNVANYAETEQALLFTDGRVSSYVQIRGSIPLLWEQPVTLKYTPKCVLAGGNGLGSSGAGAVAFAKHMVQQLDRYHAVTAVNLIDKKGDQGKLGEAYAAACASFTPPPPATTAPRGGGGGSSGKAPQLKYVWFDFHHECRKMKWENLSKLLGQVRDFMDESAMYIREADGTVLKQQSGVFRTNCMDNLDRTNVVQSLFARQAALAAIPGALEKTRAATTSVLDSPFPEFEVAFKNLWADNADAISRLYSGTGALKTDFTRTGKRSMSGALQDGVNSVTRYVLNNLADGRMQDAWDLFLGRFVPKRGSHDGSRAIEAHLRELTPTSFLLRTLVLFAGITAAVAWFATHEHTPLTTRLAWGAAGASVVLGGLAYVLVSKGTGLGKRWVNKPRLLPSYAHQGRDHHDLVGGLHTREPVDVKGNRVSVGGGGANTTSSGGGGSGAAMTAGSATAASVGDDSGRAKLA